MKGIILHGGHGTRLRPLTHTGPKQLIPIANKPISQYVLEGLRDSGVIDIAIVLGDVYPEKIKEYYGDGSRFGVRTTYIRQGKPKGIAHAVGVCKEFVENDPFVVYLGDNLLRGGISKFVEQFRNANYDGMILLCEVKHPERFGVAKFDGKGKLIQLIEKPKEPPSHYALTGIYFFSPLVFKMIRMLKPSWRGELEITEAIQLLLDDGYDVAHRFVTGWWKDAGTPADILESNRLILDDLNPKMEGLVEDETSLQGRVSIGMKSIIKRGAIIRGPTIIGHNTLIEADVYIGPYSSIGHNVVVKQGTIENSIIMDHCLIDVNACITDSLIGSQSSITSSINNRPLGRRFIIGERSYIEL